MMAREVRILLLEDEPSDAELIEGQLKDDGLSFVSRRVATREAFIQAIGEFVPDVVLADYQLPSFNGLEAIRIIRNQSPETPVLIVTGVMRDDAVVELLREGAADYILKDRLARLASAVSAALEKASQRTQLARLTRFRTVTSNINREIIHAREVGPLYQSICNLVVRDAGFVLAWVGEIQPGTGALLCLASAASGHALECQSHAWFPWKDMPEIGSIAEAFLHQKLPIIIANELERVHELPWIESARKAGIRSIAMVPLLRSGKPVAMLAVSADKEAYFDQEIAKMLEEIAAEISFSLDFIANEGQRRAAEEGLQRSLAALERAIQGTIAVIGTISEARDPYTRGHEQNVGDIAAAIAVEMGLPSDRVKGVRIAGYLHDVGKIGVPADILSKPARLSSTEYAIVREHAERGHEILKAVEFPWPIAQFVWEHHERLDGSGYPRGLSGEAISLEARILAVADTVEAMTAHRPFRAAMPVEKVLAEIQAGRATCFDPQVVDACLRLFHEKGYTLPGRQEA